MGPAARRWADELEAWAIPDEIRASVPDTPWGFPTALFGAPHLVPALDSPSRRRALEVLPPGGTVLDVGVGGGAGSLPLVPPAARIVGVDESDSMLAAFADRAAELGTDHAELQGRWPDVAPAAPAADVVVCHHVFYNVADLVPFASALGDHARRRVVVELTAIHPLVAQTRLWQRFHPDVPRPSGPTADDAVAVLTEADIEVEAERSVRPSRVHGSRAHWVSFIRRRLCVPADREPEIDALLGDADELVPRDVVTLWWDGHAV